MKMKTRRVIIMYDCGGNDTTATAAGGAGTFESYKTELCPLNSKLQVLGRRVVYYCVS